MRSNPKRLFSFYASSNESHYRVTMTSHNDPRTWCHEPKACFLLKCQSNAHTTPRTSAFITLRNDRHVWTDRNSLTGIDRHWVRRKFSKLFLHKLHLKCIPIAGINDNKNFPPSLFRSLYEFVGDCSGPLCFSSAAALPQKNTSVRNNHFRFHTVTSKTMVRSYYCLIKNFGGQPEITAWLSVGQLLLFS